MGDALMMVSVVAHPSQDSSGNRSNLALLVEYVKVRPLFPFYMIVAGHREIGGDNY
jgi:hypothetical protein